MRTTALHVVLLWSLAVAQPIYDVFGRYAELFVARRTPPFQIWLLVLLLSLALPALLAASLAGLRLASRRAASLATWFLVGALAAMIALPVCKRFGFPAPAAIACALVIGAISAVLYHRQAVIRGFLTVLSPAVLIFPVVFLFLTPVVSMIFPQREAGGPWVEWRRTPVVIVVFDALPVTALMDEAGEVDAVRFPAFARLATDAVWFRQARTVAPETSAAVPALLAGRSTVLGTLPIVAEYPQSLFTLVGPRTPAWIFESMTWLCPESLCGQAEEQVAPPRLAGLLRDSAIVYLHILTPVELAGRLPAVDQQWGDFANAETPRSFAGPTRGEDQREQRLQIIRERRKKIAREDLEAKLQRFLDGLPRGSGPSLSYLHLKLPHGPYHYLPSGRRYVDPGSARRLNLEMLQGRAREKGHPRWQDDESLVDFAYRRLVLQIGYTDRLLGRILDHLEELGIYDEALVVVTADHGQSYRPGGFFREMGDGGTVHVPFFVKAPHTRRGAIDDRSVDLRDLLPTIAGVLGFEIPWKVEGRGLLDPDRLEQLRARDPSGADADQLPRGDWPSPLLEEDLRLKIVRVGAGEWDEVYAAGPAPELLGLRIDALSEGSGVALATHGNSVKARLDQSEALTAVDPASGYVPAYLMGAVELPPGTKPPVDLVLAIDGVIRSTARTYRRGKHVCYSMLVPESVFSPGSHEWAAYVIERQASSPEVLLTETLR
ncbi:MAG: sulfatase-like hydrolase/transferase [bacterium]|nr:sulfatase-like hydrolase/transferase [bacterium]